MLIVLIAVVASESFEYMKRLVAAFCLVPISAFAQGLIFLVFGMCFFHRHDLGAQTLTTLYNFSAPQGPPGPLFSGTNADGAGPVEIGGLIVSEGVIYGTAENGGFWQQGTVFKLNIDSSGFTNLYNFTAMSEAFLTNSDGAKPVTGLVLLDDTLYGTTMDGGSGGTGTVFRISTNGSRFADLAQSLGSPRGPLTLSGYTLFGTTYYGGLFMLNIDGSGFTNLLGSLGNPQAGLLLSGNTLYSSTMYGGPYGNGNVYKISTDGSGFDSVYNFTNSSVPLGTLVLCSNFLYGTTYQGGIGKGSVFRVGTDGTGFSDLHEFTGTSGDGASPWAGLVLSGNTLYGVTAYGGTSDKGMIFSVQMDGTGFTNLYSFNSTDGVEPLGGLVVWGKMLYGTTAGGGLYGGGTIFSLSLPSITLPELTITASDGNVIVTWPTNPPNWVLQSTTNLASPVWTSIAIPPVVVNGLNTVTNAISATYQLFRLSQ